jgi:predicted nuclease of predicted toxin-antitoxin system
MASTAALIVVGAAYPSPRYAQKIESRMNDEVDIHEWHEFPWEDAPDLPPGRHKKLKLLADANVPRPIIEELREAGIVVTSVVEEGLASHPDENILQLSRKLDTVLLTLDRDFWVDRQHPLRKSPGIIFVDIPPDQGSKVIDGLAKFYGIFAQRFPLDCWGEMRARISEDSFVLKYITWEGRISEDEFRLSKEGKLLTRTLK